MLLAASESAVTKKPRLRLTRRRSSSVRPFGFFHSSISRCMFTSCGIQWLAQPARYLSHAHLYLNGTSWFTSVLPLMMRLSSALTRLATRSAVTSSPAAPVGSCGWRGAVAASSSQESMVNILQFFVNPRMAVGRSRIAAGPFLVIRSGWGAATPQGGRVLSDGDSTGVRQVPAPVEHSSCCQLTGQLLASFAFLETGVARTQVARGALFHLLDR